MTAKIQFSVRVFVNGKQLGDNATFAEWYASEDAAIADQRAYFESQGYNVTISIQDLPQWDGTPAMRTLIVELTR
jgi:hypothetical protein